VDEQGVASMRRIESGVLRLLRRVRRTATENARLVHPDLQATGYGVLMCVMEHEPMRAVDVVEALDMDKGAVSRQVAQLHQLGLLSRTDDPEDRRAHHLVLSDEGRRRLAVLRDRRRDELESRLASWSPADLAAFAEQLGHYNASFEA
jgi:DNA-binding MarR family transcriptional regulator